jgi:hypothetical protein
MAVRGYNAMVQQAAIGNEMGVCASNVRVYMAGMRPL